MLDKRLYLSLITFISFNKFPKLIFSDNKNLKDFFDVDIDLNQIFYSSLLFSSVLFVLLVIVSFSSSLIGFNVSLLLFLSVIVCFMVFYLLFSFPSSYFNLVLVDELSRAPLTVALLISYLRVNPNLEVGISRVFSGRNDFVSRSFVGIVRKSLLGKRLSEELSALAASLGRFSEGFKRCVLLIRQGVLERDSSKRDDVLDKGLMAFLKDVEFNSSLFGQRLVSYSLVIFTVGVVIPLVGLSLLPLSSFFSPASSVSLVFGVLFLVLIVVFILTDKLLASRPVSLFMSAQRSSSFSVSQLLSSLIIFMVISTPSFALILLDSGFFSFGVFNQVISSLGFIPLFFGVCLALSFYFFVSSKDEMKVILRAESLESSLPDCLDMIASDLSDGLPLETSIGRVSKSFSGVLPELFGRANGLVRNRHLSVKDAFSKVFKDSNSFLIGSVASFLSDCESHGSRTVSSALFSLSYHLSELKRIARESRARLEHSLSMMEFSVLFFAPMVCGLSVVLSSILSSSISSLSSDLSGAGFAPVFINLFSSKSVNPQALSVLSFFYLLFFSLIVSRFLVYVKNGGLQAVLRFELSKILLIVTTVYSLTLVAGSVLFGV